MARVIFAVIPALNEEKTISSVVEGLFKTGLVDKVIVVDDGSKDSTEKNAIRSGALVLKHKSRIGYDKSLDDGFLLAKEKGADIIFSFDADGQHDASDLKKILDPIIKGEADLVVGVRPNKQRWAESVFASYSKFSIGVSDPLCGFKAYSIRVYDSVGHFDRVNSIGTELLFRARDRKFRIREVGISIKERRDKPRFGRIVRANVKILLAMFGVMSRKFYK